MEPGRPECSCRNCSGDAMSAFVIYAEPKIAQDLSGVGSSLLGGLRGGEARVDENEIHIS